MARRCVKMYCECVNARTQAEKNAIHERDEAYAETPSKRNFVADLLDEVVEYLRDDDAYVEDLERGQDSVIRDWLRIDALRRGTTPA